MADENMNSNNIISKAKSAILIVGVMMSVVAAFITSKLSLVNLPGHWEKDEYSHGYLIPFIAVYIGWHLLVQNKPTISSSWLGPVITFVAAFIALFSGLSAFETLMNYAFLISLIGITLSFFGGKVTLSLMPAFAFLFFAVPLPQVIYSNASIQMQLVSTSIGAGIIKLFGYSLYQEGNIIDLGHMQLQVAEACSGLRYLFPLASLGFLIAYLMNAAWWKRMALFISVVPITILMNSIRIGLIGVTVNLWGQEMAEGILHSFEGYVVFSLCLAALLLEVWFFIRYTANVSIHDHYLNLPKGSMYTGKIALSLSMLMVLIFCIAGAFSSQYALNNNKIVSVVPNFEKLPVQINNWMGHRKFLTSEEIRLLGLSDYWMVDFNHQTSSDLVNFYIAHYGSQKIRAKVHIPLDCILGSGWEVQNQSTDNINIGNEVVPISRLIIKKDTEKVLVYYWLDQGGVKTNSLFKSKWLLAMNALKKGRTDSGLIRVTTPLAKNEEIENADTRLKNFLQEIYPHVDQYISAETKQ